MFLSVRNIERIYHETKIQKIMLEEIAALKILIYLQMKVILLLKFFRIIWTILLLFKTTNLLFFYTTLISRYGRR